MNYAYQIQMVFIIGTYLQRRKVHMNVNTNLFIFYQAVNDYVHNDYDTQLVQRGKHNYAHTHRNK